MHQKESFFIIGIPRSGTTLLEKILDNHSEIAVCPESVIFKILARLGIKKNYPSAWHYQYFMIAVAERLSNFNDPASEVVLDYLKKHPDYKGDVFFLLNELKKKYLAQKNKPVFGEKTPENLDHLGLIKKTCPNAKYVFILRNPLDIVCSMSQLFSKKTSKKPFSNHLLLKSAHFVKRMMPALYDDKIIEPNKKTYLKYEDLVNNPEQELKFICHFLSLSYEDAMLDFNARNYINPNNKTLLNTHQNLTKPINNSSVNTYLKNLSNSQIKMLQLFFKEDLNKTDYVFPENNETLDLGQKYVLLKHQILYKINIEALKEYYIRFKIWVKYFLHRKFQ